MKILNVDEQQRKQKAIYCGINTHTNSTFVKRKCWTAWTLKSSLRALILLAYWCRAGRDFVLLFKGRSLIKVVNQLASLSFLRTFMAVTAPERIKPAVIPDPVLMYARKELESNTFNAHVNVSLRKQPTFRKVATWALAKRRLSNERRNSLLMTCNTQILVVLLTGCAAREFSFSQSEALPRFG